MPVEIARVTLELGYHFPMRRLRVCLMRLLLAGSALACAAGPAAASEQKPELSVTTLAGEEFDLASQRGHVVLVHFWATWCPPCLKEMPALEAFYERYRARGVEVIALSEDRTRDMVDVHRMMRDMKMSYPVAMAHTASRNSFGNPSALPVTLVVDSTGVLRAELRPQSEPVTEEALGRIVEPLLSTIGAAPGSR